MHSSECCHYVFGVFDDLFKFHLYDKGFTTTAYGVCRAVERVITQTITEKLFGDDISLRSSQDFIIDLPNGTSQYCIILSRP